MAMYAEGAGNEIYIEGINPSAYNLDAFGNLRVTRPVNQFNSLQTYWLNEYFWDDIKVSGGDVVYDSDTNATTVSCTSTPGSRAVLQQHNYNRYQPWRSQFIKFTGTFNSGSIRLVRRSSVGGTSNDYPVENASFSHDHIDGSGPSGFDINMANSNIYTISFQYLGVGAIAFGMANKNGVPFPIHVIENANARSGLYMRTASLPFRVEVYNDGTNTYKRFGYFDDNDGLFYEVVEAAGAASVDFLCCSVDTENGEDIFSEVGFPVPASTDDNGFDFDAVFRPVLSIRPKLLFKGKTNRAILLPENLSVILENRFARVALVLNPTSLSGGSWVSVGDNSTAEKRVSTGGSSISGGTLLREYYVDSSSSFALKENFIGKLGLSLDALGTTQDVLSVCIERLTTSSTAHVGLNSKELY